MGLLTLLAATDVATWHVILSIAAICLFLWGVERLIHQNFVAGAVLIVLAFAVGPGGWSLLS